MGAYCVRVRRHFVHGVREKVHRALFIVAYNVRCRMATAHSVWHMVHNAGSGKILSEQRETGVFTETPTPTHTVSTRSAARASPPVP